jgi:hypothetical protein
MGWIRKIHKNKMERMEEKKRRDFYICGGLILMCSALVGNTKGYRPRATLPQENPLICEPALQL